MGEFPEKIWAIEKGYPSRYRVSCSVLEHGPDEATEYVRADLYAALEAKLAERPMKKFYVLQGEYGEYEQRTENTYGVFDTRDQALDAMHKVPRLSEEGYARYKDFERRCEELAALEGAPKVETHILAQTEKERAASRKHVDKVQEIKSRIGPEPDFFCKSERYWITEFVVGEIGCGNVVFDTDSGADESAALEAQLAEAKGKLNEIACWSQSQGLLWWQVKAREALSALEATPPAARHIGKIAHIDHGKTSITAAIARLTAAQEEGR